VTHSDMFYSDVRMTLFFGDGDGGRGWSHSGAIAAGILQTPNYTANV